MFLANFFLFHVIVMSCVACKLRFNVGDGGECLFVLFDSVAVLFVEGMTLALVSVFVGVKTWR